MACLADTQVRCVFKTKTVFLALLFSTLKSGIVTVFFRHKL